MAPVSSPIPDLAARLDAAMPFVVLGAVKLVKRDADTEAARVAGPDRRLSNAGRRGTKLRTRDTWRRGATSATVFAVPAGPWRWVNDGTGPHIIGAGRASRRTGNYSAAKVRRRKRLTIGAGVVTGPVFHPGTRGKGAWRRVLARAPARLREAGHAELRRLVRG